jgi:hypothetical protein
LISIKSIISETRTALWIDRRQPKCGNHHRQVAEDALKVLLSRDDYLASHEGPDNPNQKTDAQKDFSTILKAVRQYAASIGATNFDPGRFPANTGLVKGEDCNLVNN